MEIFVEECPYLPEHEAVAAVCSDENAVSQYESYLEHGWRRSGRMIYRYMCKHCNLCIPIRIEAGETRWSKRARRTIAVNADLDHRLTSPDYTNEYFDLYRRYMISRHPDSAADIRASFLSLLDSPMGGLLEYREKSGTLVGLSFLDITSKALSSAYFAFDPRASHRSLGINSVYKEVEMAKTMGKHYYYLGYWVPNSKKMNYKADFYPFELLLDQENFDWETSISAHNKLSIEPHWIRCQTRRDAVARIVSLTAIG